MKQKLSILFSIFLLYFLSGTVPTQAATYTVKAGGGGDFTTIASCISAMSASGGDTCTVFAGTYSESPTIKAGTTGNYNVLTVNSGDTATINGGTTINSHTKLNGFVIAPSSFNPPCVSVGASATDWFVTNNVMSQCGRSSGEANDIPSTASFGYYGRNTISYPCTTSNVAANGGPCAAFENHGSHIMFENNDISHVSDGWTLTAGSFNVFRGNTQHDTSENECNTAPVHGGNCHIDFISSEPSTTTQFELYEGNADLNGSGGDAHVFLVQGDVCPANSCNNIIIRYNHAYNIGTFWLLNDLGTFNHVKDYNNTFAVALNPQEDLLSFLETNTFGAAKNDLWYDASPNDTEWYQVNATSGFSDGNNLGYLSSCAPSCRFTAPNGFGMGHAGVGNITNQDPKFVNPTSDWHLQASSPAIGAGGALTTASGSGSSSTTLVVADADYFQDGMGLTSLGVQPDWIRIGNSTTVQISSVNYLSHTLTLAKPASWNSGEPVYLYKNSTGTTVLTGSNPDIGAFPTQTQAANPPAPPSDLVAMVQ